MYKLFTDTDKQFTAEVDVQGAPLSECKARIILESENINLLYNGTIDKSGKCNVNIGRLKNVLKESDSGKLKLEIIAEDTLFTAWETNFVVDTKKKVSINEVIDSDSKMAKESEPEIASVKVKVNVEEDKEIDLTKHIKILENEMIKRKIDSRDKFNTLINTYRNITKKRNVLTEVDMKSIEQQLTTKYFN
jgi:hypothetical protein